MKRLSMPLFLLFTLLLTSIGASEVLAQQSEDEGDIPVVTVRKRYFLKSHRSEIGLNAAWLPNDTFVRSYALGASYGYHFNESFFIEVPAGIILNSDSDSTTFLRDNFGVTPDLDDMKWYASAHVGWSPIYGKLAFMSKKVVYFDSSFYTGLGASDARVSGISPHLVLGLAQRFVLSKWMALRFDIKDNIGYRDDTGVDSALRHTFFVTAGLSFFMPVR